MWPEISDNLMRFMLFVYLVVRLWHDLIYKAVRFFIGGGNK
jgi:hypothetical protein